MVLRHFACVPSSDKFIDYLFELFSFSLFFIRVRYLCIFLLDHFFEL